MVFKIFALLLNAKAFLLKKGHFLYQMFSHYSLTLRLVELDEMRSTLTSVALLLLRHSRYSS